MVDMERSDFSEPNISFSTKSEFFLGTIKFQAILLSPQIQKVNSVSYNLERNIR